ncbi:RHS repeat-associated core domain-containing protein [Dentiradicibacter hellwigii]|uniref:RHS repeat-associated core domain-containing protein n=1 Tax=Dentiradicibacter hellwigii TaxID=3149053 RepID=A0ABV4UG86_9RHOO
MSGQFHDRITGLYYNRHRFYDPRLGAYISQDPIGLKGGINLSAYVRNPVQWMDPWGLWEIPSLPRGNDDNFAGFFWNRLIDGQVRDDIFDYARGFVIGVASVPRGWFRAGYQGARHLSCNKQAEIERRVVKTAFSNKHVRSVLMEKAKSEALDFNNYTAKNIGKFVGRSITSVITRPFGILSILGDSATAVNQQGDIFKAILLGD